MIHKNRKMKKLLLYVALSPQSFNRVIPSRGAQIVRIAKHTSTIISANVVYIHRLKKDKDTRKSVNF